MLILHGANDVRCKIAESDQIVAAMQAKGIPVTYVVYPDEGHGFEKPENRLAEVAITEVFFAKHLGGALEPMGSDLEGSSHEFGAGAHLLEMR
jgi:dipeptidyl aminopeptidase/acylaminoacyl peptidase